MKKQVADKIRIKRLGKNLSQQNMADELGITIAAYSNIERGVTDISVSRLTQIATILDEDIITFLGESGQRQFVSEPDAFGEYFKNGLTQQIYMLIQEIQALKEKVVQLEKEVEQLMRKG